MAELFEVYIETNYEEEVEGKKGLPIRFGARMGLKFRISEDEQDDWRDPESIDKRRRWLAEQLKASVRGELADEGLVGQGARQPDEGKK